MFQRHNYIESIFLLRACSTEKVDILCYDDVFANKRYDQQLKFQKDISLFS